MSGGVSRGPLPSPDAMFGRFTFDAGGLGGARQRFQLLITDLVAVRHSTANEVALPSGSDWGIDTYVGELDGSIVVWQAKFFPEWTGESQRGNVRASFDEVIKKATEEGFSVSAWTLCVPCILPPGEQKWFDGWKRRKEAATGVRIQLWNGPAIRGMLMQPDSAYLRDAYFPGTPSASLPEPVQVLDETVDLSGALFVRQLEEAGRRENDAAKGLFFAAEALVRDVASRGDEDGKAALDALHVDIHDLWERHFNGMAPAASSDGRIGGLIEIVMDGAAAAPDPDGIRLRPAHRKGVAHRVVEDGKAGWVAHWRDVAVEHGGAGQVPPPTDSEPGVTVGTRR